MSKGTYRDMWVYAERKDDELSAVAKEMISEARRLMDKYNVDYKANERVIVAVIGNKVDKAAKQALEYGADIVVQLDSPELEFFRLEAYTHALFDASIRGAGWDYDKPRYFLFPATHNGRDLSATYCAEAETGCASDCNKLYIENPPIKHRFKTGGNEMILERILHMKRPDFSGFEWSTILCIDNPEKDFHPQTCSVIPGSFKATPATGRPKGQIKKPAPKLNSTALRVKTTSRKPVQKLDLTRYDNIVALGRGISENPTKGFQLGVELARQMEAGLGLSRGVVTASYNVDGSVKQYLDEVRQIGETGQTVKPKVYVALGISGAIQHKKGMDQSAFIVTVNNDPETPIREFSDVYIVGDIFEVVPKLAAAIEKNRGKK